MTELELIGLFQNLALVPIKTPCYRMYYNQAGCVTLLTTELVPGNYIEVDSATYTQGHINTRIVNGQITKVVAPVHVARLYVSDHGVACAPDNVCVVVSSEQPHKNWKVKNRETH